MGISLVGIIIVQILWIKNAIEIREAQFDQSVSAALTAVVTQLDKDKNINIISQNYWNSEESIDQHYIRMTDSSITHNLVWTSDESIFNIDEKSEGAIIINSEKDDFIRIEELNNEGVRIKTIKVLDSLKDKISEEKYLVMSQFEDSVNVIIRSKFSNVSKKNLELEDVIEEMVVEIESLADDDHFKLKELDIKNRILENLSDFGISIPFEYGVYNPTSDSLLLASSDQVLKKDVEASYKTRLYPNNILKKPDLLFLNFPGKRTYLFRSLALLLWGSAFFTLVILFTFYITIRIILNQKRLSEIKTDFINNMTHEFKTPIATISLAVDSINNKKIIGEPEKVRYFTGIINEENKRMNSKVENVLQMSLIDKKEFDFHFETIAIHETIQQVANSYELQLKNKQGELLLKLKSEKHQIETDKTHFTNVLSNLIDNAIKYSKKPVIRITTESKNDELRFSISDNGIGMSKAEQEKIFDKFYRVSKGDIHNIKGFGLGLSYVKAVILAWGGKINVKSTINQGSEFEIKLPLKPVPNES